jgi:hypothetical protein
MHTSCGVEVDEDIGCCQLGPEHDQDGNGVPTSEPDSLSMLPIDERRIRKLRE